MFHGFDLKNNYDLYIIPKNGEESTLEGIDIQKTKIAYINDYLLGMTHAVRSNIC